MIFVYDWVEQEKVFGVTKITWFFARSKLLYLGRSYKTYCLMCLIRLPLDNLQQIQWLSEGHHKSRPKKSSHI